MSEPHCFQNFLTNARLGPCLIAPPGCLDRCPFPTREQKDALLQEVRKTDPEYSLIRLNRWFSNRRRLCPESRKKQDDALNALLNPKSPLAGESRSSVLVDTHGLLYSLVWPSLSADTLYRLHVMLLEQTHPTEQHKELLAKHFNAEREHVENFLNWRLACLNNGDNDVRQENPQRGRKPLPTTTFDDDTMEIDELAHSQPYLPTPAGSTSPEPVHGMTPFIRAKMGRRESLDTGPIASGKYEPNSPTSPVSLIESNSPSRTPALRISTDATPRQANSPDLPSPTSHLRRSPKKPSPDSPSSPLSSAPNAPPSDASPKTFNTRQEDRSHTGAHGSTSVASVEEPLRQAPGPATRIPRTLREFEEAYALTSARIERFLRNVESNKLVHVGLTPEMLKQTRP